VVEQAAAARVVCLGEAMVVLRPEGEQQALTSAELFRRSVGGAEANVAGALAALGVSAAGVSRLGADPFGDVVADDLTGRGVRVLAERDPGRPTGLYLKDPQASAGSRMYYYRAGSAAAAMDADLLDRSDVAAAVAGAELVHTSGITAGSTSAWGYSSRWRGGVTACGSCHYGQPSVTRRWTGAPSWPATSSTSRR
jgi:2-dehydro-3-deoxygluconokinase